jgi:hypothetical protein
MLKRDPRLLCCPVTILVLVLVAQGAAQIPRDDGEGGEHLPVEITGTESPQSVQLANAERFDITTSNGRASRIFVAIPIGSPPPAGWPVIYMTDANDNLPVASQGIDFVLSPP